MKSIDARDVAYFRVLQSVEKFSEISEENAGRAGGKSWHSRVSFLSSDEKEFSRKSQLLVAGRPLIAPIYAPLLPFGRKEIRDMFIKR